MAGRTYACILAAAIAACCAPGAQAQAAKADSKVEVKGVRDASRWFRIESEHVIVLSDSRSEGVVELVKGLERLDFLVRTYLKPYLVGQAGAPKPTLYFQDRVRWLPELDERPAAAIGLFNSCSAGVQAFTFNVEPIVAMEEGELAKGGLNEALSIVFEAYARHFLYRNTDIRAPASFIDGFAQYFSSVRFSDKQLVVGRVPPGMGRYLYFLDEGAPYQLTYDEVLEAEEITRPDDAAVRLEYQARAWNLMHFMLSSERNRARMTQYLELVNAGMVPARAFTSAYGLQSKTLNTAMWRYRQGGVQAVRVDVPDLPQARLDFTRLSAAMDDFVLADAALKSCPGRRAGEALLARLAADAARAPGVDFAQLTLSRAQVDWGQPRDALGYLEGAAERDSGNAEVHYLLGLAKLKLAQQARGGAGAELLAAARRSLARAAALRPGAPEVSFALYRAELLGASEPDRTGIARAIVAWRHAHEVPAFARSAALAYAWMGDAAGARRAFGILAGNRRDPENAAWASVWLKRLGKGVPRAELLAAMRAEPAPESAHEPVFKEWMIAYEDVATAVQRKASMDKARVFIESMMLGDPTNPDATFRLPTVK